MTRNQLKRGVAIWLIALLILLSFAASVHRAEHLEHGAQDHCTLCFHKHQLNKLLPSHAFHLTLTVQKFEPAYYLIPHYQVAHSSVYRSRAPPATV